MDAAAGAADGKIGSERREFVQRSKEIEHFREACCALHAL